MLVLDHKTPLLSAKRFIDERYTTSGVRTLHHQGGLFHAWTGTHYRSIESDSIRAGLYEFLDTAHLVSGNDGVAPFHPTIARVNNVFDALKAIAILRSDLQPPCWLQQGIDVPPADFAACNNGLLHLPTRVLYPNTPVLFNTFARPFPYDPNAPVPTLWLSFLNSLWPNDNEAIGTLQEMFGYCLTDDTSQQQIFMMVGPKRSGKGTIARVFTGLVGQENVVNPTLATFQSNFGLASLIGKQLAIISDARLSGRADQQVIAERLLAISGEDSTTIDRKFLSPWTGRLPTRFLIMTNELPRLTDVSGALASRFITLVLTESFFGREDHGLTARLLAELPSILNWALEGRSRLAERGRFVQPRSSTAVAQELEDLGSPISLFLRERCIIGPGNRAEVARLYSAWGEWCLKQGRNHYGTKQSFGRDLRAAVPGLKQTQPRVGDERNRFYEGIALCADVARTGTRSISL